MLLMGCDFLDSVYCTKFIQFLKHGGHPSSEHHLLNTCKEPELLSEGFTQYAVLLLKQALISKVGPKHQEHICLKNEHEITFQSLY